MTIIVGELRCKWKLGVLGYAWVCWNSDDEKYFGEINSTVMKSAGIILCCELIQLPTDGASLPLVAILVYPPIKSCRDLDGVDGRKWCGDLNRMHL